jgi:hypothetical protein
MADIRISKIKLRRGTNTQRKQVILDQGELVYTTDTKRLYVGNGVLSGGESPASVVHLPTSTYNSLSTIVAERGDLVYANSKFYQLTGTNYAAISGWADVSLKVSNQFSYNSSNTLTLASSSVSAANLKPETVSNGIKIENHILQTNFNTKSLEISAFKLSLKAGGIDEREVNSTSFGNGISGGSGNKISLAVNSQYLFFDNGVLSLTSIPVSSNITPLSADETTLYIDNGLIYVLPDGINETRIASSSFGGGISGGSGQKISLKYDPTTFFINGSGQLAYNNNLSLSSFDPYAINATFVGKGAGVNSAGAAESVFVGLSAGAESYDAQNSIFIGEYAGYNLQTIDTETTTQNAVFIGSNAGYESNNSVFSNFIGSFAGSNSDISTYSNFFGAYAGSSSVLASRSNLFGFEAGFELSGNNVNAIGYQAGKQLIGNDVNAIGYQAGKASKGNNNNFIGSYSASSSLSGDNLSGDNNNFFGAYAGSDSLSASRSNLFGFEAGFGLSGNDVNAIGYQAGKASKGDNNIFIGSNTSTLSSNISGCLVVGMSAKAVESNTVVLGSTNFKFLTAVAGANTLLGLAIRINGVNYTLPLYTRI